MILKEDINRLTRQYNDAIHALEDSYDMEYSQGNFGLMSSRKLKKQYSQKYEKLASEYLATRRQMFNDYKLSHPEWAKSRKLWGWVMIIGMMAAMVCCGASLPTEEGSAVSSLAATDTEAWSAENIPIPYLQDSLQYVSNPDNVLSQDAVNRMNTTLHRLDSELDIQSVVIVVNHIKNDDPFRFAQDVGNKYGVGNGDRGLVVVVGYLDHSINMSPGRALEADLTDAECHRLEQEYVVPSMRAEMPDSGMIYLTEAVYSTLQKKQLPKMSSLYDNDTDDGTLGVIGLTMLFYVAWFILFLRLNRKYQWLGVAGTIPLLNNPFYVAESYGSSGGGFGGFSGGGGHSFGGGGGSFGGGSFGGGGATSRW